MIWRLALSGSLALLAIGTGAQAVAQQPGQAELQRAAANLRVLAAALESKDVPAVLKGVLVSCVYSHPFGTISANTDKALAARKADRDNPDAVISAMAGVCGMDPDARK